MGKLSINLPDDLEERLRRYSEEHQLPLSQTVAQALELFLTPGPPHPPSPPPAQDLEEVQGYVTTLASSLEAVRRVLEACGLTGAPWPGGPTLPPPLPCPPWASMKWPTDQTVVLRVCPEEPQQ